MIYVFLCGVVGFFVFDAYRVRKTLQEQGRVEITFSDPIAIATHVAVYVAAGVLGVFVSLDMLTTCCVEREYEWRDIFGSLVRSFAIGLAGPAGLSKGQTSLSSRANETKGPPTDDLSGLKKFGSTLRILFMR